MSVNVSKNLVKPVKRYQVARRYETFSRAANELIRVGLEIVEEIEEAKKSAT